MPTLPADDVWRKDAPNNAALIYSAVSNLLADWSGAQPWLRAGHAMLCECIWGFIRPGGTWTSALMHMWACSKGSHQVLCLQYQCSRQTILFRSSFLGQMHFKLPKCKKFSSETLNFLAGNRHQQMETHMCKLCMASEHTITFCSAAWGTHPSAWELIVL